MQGAGAYAFVGQIAGQVFSINLCAGKYNSLNHVRVLQPVVQQLALVATVVGPHQFLSDVSVGFILSRHFNALGVVHDVFSQTDNALGKGGGEHQCLNAVAAQLVDGFQVFGEAQVEHAVGLVNDQGGHGAQVQFALLGQIEQAAGCAHNNAGTTQAGHLFAVGHAANNGCDTNTLGEFHQVDGVLANLLGQFTGGAQHQAFWASQHFHGALFAGHHAMHNGQQETESFAATGLAGNHQVSAFFAEWYHFSLYGGRGSNVQSIQGLQQRRGKTHVIK